MPRQVCAPRPATHTCVGQGGAAVSQLQLSRARGPPHAKDHTVAQPNLFARSEALCPPHSHWDVDQHERNGSRTEFKYLEHQTTFARCCLDPQDCTCSSRSALHPADYASLSKNLVMLSGPAFFCRKFEKGFPWFRVQGARCRVPKASPPRCCVYKIARKI